MQGRDEISVFMQTGRHFGFTYEKCEALDEPMPITISLGISPVELVEAGTIDEVALASAEIVIEGPGRRRHALPARLDRRLTGGVTAWLLTHGTRSRVLATPATC